MNRGEIIISVGYRVKSQRGTQFRIWDNKVLKDYIIKGYAVNEKMRIQQYNDLKQTIKLLSNVIQNRETALTADEASGLLQVITDYTKYMSEPVNINRLIKIIGMILKPCFSQKASIPQAAKISSPLDERTVVNNPFELR
jgi:hypothetical protein